MTAPDAGTVGRKRNRRVLLGVCAAGVLVLVPVGVLAWAFSDQTAVNGALSVSPDRDGGVRLNLTVCSGAVDLVELYDQRLHPTDYPKPDVPVGIWRRTAAASADDVLVFGNPGPEWTVELDPGRLDDGAMYGALAFSSAANTELAQVDFDPGRVAKLPAGGAFYYDSQPVQASAVRAAVCG